MNKLGSKGGDWHDAAVRSSVKGTPMVGILEAIELLFMRLLQLSPGVRPRFAVVPGRGVEVHVAVYLGAVPPKLAEHAERTSTVHGAPMVKPGEQAYVSATGPTADLALVKLRDHLALGLKQRIESDLAIWEKATGGRWGGAGALLLLNQATPDGDEGADTRTSHKGG